MNEEELRDPDTIPLQDALLDAFCEVRLMERGELKGQSWEEFKAELEKEIAEEKAAIV